MRWFFFFLRKKVRPKCIIRPKEHNNLGLVYVWSWLTGSSLIHSEVVGTSFCCRHWLYRNVPCGWGQLHQNLVCMFSSANSLYLEIEKRLENCFYKEDRSISSWNCTEILQWFQEYIRTRKAFLQIEEYTGIITVKDKETFILKWHKP